MLLIKDLCKDDEWPSILLKRGLIIDYILHPPVRYYYSLEFIKYFTILALRYLQLRLIVETEQLTYNIK